MKKIYLEPTTKLVKLNLNSSIMDGVFMTLSGSTDTVGGKEDIEDEKDFGW